MARLHLARGDAPRPLLDRALARARQERFPRAEREVQRLRGEVALGRGDLAQAEEAWQEAYTIAQREGIPLGPYLADLARLHSAQHDDARAKVLLSEALALGGRGVALATVEVFITLGEHVEARRHVEAAYLEAWADGPPHAFAHELTRARAALHTLNMPEPKLPPFDPLQVPPIPEEDNIQAFLMGLDHKRRAAIAIPPASLERDAGKRQWWKFWVMHK